MVRLPVWTCPSGWAEGPGAGYKCCGGDSELVAPYFPFANPEMHAWRESGACVGDGAAPTALVAEVCLSPW